MGSILEGQSFAKWLRQQLARREWKQADFARRSGFNTGRVSYWMTGKDVPSPESCDRIADILGVDVDTVLTLAGHRPHIDEPAPDDQAAMLCAKVHRINLTEDRIALLNSMLDGMREFDAKKKREIRG